MTPDAGVDDAGLVVPVCDVPDPLVAGTEETDAVADSPARCGQPSYRWLRTGIGEAVASEASGTMPLDLIETLVEALGLSLPVSPAYGAAFSTYTYVTQDRGVPVEATALYAYPTGPDASETVGTLLFLHGTVGLVDGCSASAHTETRVLAALGASMGYDVVVPDLLGLKASGEPTGFVHPYLVGEPTALAALDAVRAAMRLPSPARGGRCVPSDILIIGASQGGHAGLFVERYAPVYARELVVRGVAVAVPPAALHAQLLARVRDDQPEDGFLLAGVTAMAEWYGVSDGLASVFRDPWTDRVPQLVSEECDLFRDFDVPPTNDELFAPEFLAAVEDGDFPAPWDCIVRENDLLRSSTTGLPSDGVRPGTLFVTGEVDEYVATTLERDSYAALCDAGLPIEYLECEGAGHAEASLWALPEAMMFLADRAEGRPLDATCIPDAAPTRCSGAP
jgi:pimeloyl-ACP methyl ester carboxylesterase